MLALEFRQFGDPSQLRVVERPDPQAAESTAIVRVHAASVNPSDVKNVAGKMPQTTLPRVPGRDYSGVVVEGPAEWRDAEVWGTGGDVGFTRDGTHAQLLAVPCASLVRKPAALSHDQAASIGVTFLTAWIAVVEYARLAAGETLAVIGASGGVGHAAVQLAQFAGARVIGITRTKPAPAGTRADVVFDTVGGAMFESALRLLAHRGRLVEISGGQDPHVGFNLVEFYHNESQLLGVDSLQRDLTAAARVLRALAPGFESGAYEPPPIACALPLAEAHAAYELVMKSPAGRVVLRP